MAPGLTIYDSVLVNATVRPAHAAYELGAPSAIGQRAPASEWAIGMDSMALRTEHPTLWPVMVVPYVRLAQILGDLLDDHDVANLSRAFVDIERATQWPYTTPFQPLAADARAKLASPDAARTMRDYLNAAVAARVRGPCAQVQAQTGMTPPPFTSIFNGPLFVQPFSQDAAIVWLDMRSDAILHLLYETT